MASVLWFRDSVDPRVLLHFDKPFKILGHQDLFRETRASYGEIDPHDDL